MAITTVANTVVPSVFTDYLHTMTEAKSRLVQSGALRRDPMLDGLLAGGGLVFNIPGWMDLADTAANVSIGETGTAATALEITSRTEKGVRLSRNQAWGAADLAQALAGDNVMAAIASRVQPYWTRQMQLAALATLKGVFADNTSNDSADYTHDISDTYELGVTDFSAEAVIDALHTMGDSEGDLGIILMHSVVYAKAKKNNLIDFVSDAVNGAAAQMPTFLGRQVLVDDGMPVATQDYTTYLVGAGALRMGVGQPRVPVETDRDILDATGGGSETLVTRVEWMIHPTGHAYSGSPANGGPDNTANANMLGHAGSWNRVAAERKQVKLAALITTEA